jgi:hypothetical protein
LDATKPVEERAWDVYEIVSAALDASPPRLAMALRYASVLDRMKPAAPAERMLAHAALSGRAHVLDSIPFLATEVAAAVAASRELTGDAKKEWAWQAARVAEAHADLAARQGNGALAAAIIDTALAVYGPLRKGITEELVGIRFPYTLYGASSPSVIGSYWYDRGSPTVVPALVRPARGAVSLLVFVSQGCGDLCYPGYAVLRRLATAFSYSALNVTLLTRTGGWYQNRLVANPADEAALVQTYFRNDVGLPYPMAVWATEFTRKPDGSLAVKSAPNDFAFAQALAAPLSAVLVDRDGIVRGTMGVNPANEARLHHMIAVLRGDHAAR